MRRANNVVEIYRVFSLHLLINWEGEKNTIFFSIVTISWSDGIFFFEYFNDNAYRYEDKTNVFFGKHNTILIRTNVICFRMKNPKITLQICGPKKPNEEKKTNVLRNSKKEKTTHCLWTCYVPSDLRFNDVKMCIFWDWGQMQLTSQWPINSNSFDRIARTVSIIFNCLEK